VVTQSQAVDGTVMSEKVVVFLLHFIEIEFEWLFEIGLVREPAGKFVILLFGV
jgi:hypothetical protein